MSVDQLAKKKVLYWEEHSNLILLRGYSWYKIQIKSTASAACSVHHSLLWCFHAWWWLLIGNWSNHTTQGTQVLSSNQAGNLNQRVLDCCCCSVTQLCPTLCDSMGCSKPGFPIHQYLYHYPGVFSNDTHWVDDVIEHLMLCCTLLLLPSVFPSIRVFSNESVLHIRWPKYWSFSFNISTSNEYSGLISFRIDWLDLLAVQGTLKSLLQYHSSKASIPQCSAFFVVQLSHPYMTTGKTIVRLDKLCWQSNASAFEYAV